MIIGRRVGTPGAEHHVEAGRTTAVGVAGGEIDGAGTELVEDETGDVGKLRAAIRAAAKMFLPLRDEQRHRTSLPWKTAWRTDRGIPRRSMAT